MKEHVSNTSDFSALVDFGKMINSNLEIDFTLNNLLLTCMGKLFATKGMVYLLNEGNEFELKLTKGIKKESEIPAHKFSFADYTDGKKRKFIFNDSVYPLITEITGVRGLTGLLILGQKLTRENYSEQDKRFLSTIANISATAIENAKIFEQHKKLNKELNSKVNQLSTLFDLSKEFGGVIDIKRIVKLLIFSLIGELMVTDYAVVLCGEKGIEIPETKFDEEELQNTFGDCSNFRFSEIMDRDDLTKHFPDLTDSGVTLVIPMKAKGETKGLILLGKRKNDLPYSKSDVEFATSLSSIAIISIENARMINEVIEKEKLEKELETAKSIQKSLLPQKIISPENFEIAGTSKSARQVGGDYYDVIPLNEEETLIAIGDVSGKGVQAALLMANLQAFLKSISKLDYSIEEATALINDLVSENTRMGNFITFFWGKLNNATREFHYVNAGHNPPLLIVKDKVTRLKKGGILLGVSKTVIPYQSEKVIVPAGARLVLFTDGITEALNHNMEEYGEERLTELVKNFRGSSEELLDAILYDVNRHADGKEQYDDITCVVITSKEEQ